MANHGLLIYGYNKEDAKFIGSSIAKVINKEIDLFGAAFSKNYKVKDIVLNPEKSLFEENVNKFLMFMGFNSDTINSALNNFPSNIKRPIFCGMTENNINWEVNYLMNHLIEEDKQVKN